MLAVDEVLSLARVSPKIRVSRLVAAVDRSEATLRNWRTNPPRPPQAAFETSTKLLRVIETEDTDFRLPVSEAGNRQIMQLRANMEERRYPANHSSFMRMYELDRERWAGIFRKKEGFEPQDWDAVLCCFYFRLNLTYCRNDEARRFRSDPEEWDALTQIVAHMADTALRAAKSARTQALLRLIKVSLLWRRIQPEWHRLSRKKKPSGKERASDRQILAHARTHMAQYGLFEETVNLSKELPDFVPPLFNAIAVASGLGEADRYGGLWTRLREADARFDRTWFETAYSRRSAGTRSTRPVFAANFERWVDADFSDFIDWLGKVG